MRSRDFTLLWSASASSQLGSMCTATANPLLVLLLTHSPIIAGWAGAASTFPALVMYLPAGWFVDRFNRRRLLFLSQSGRFVVYACLICGLGLGYHRTSLLVVTAFCDGTLLVIYSAAEITAVQRVVDSDRLPSALAMNEARNHLALLAGRPLGGFLYGQNRVFPYSVNVLASLWSIVALSRMKRKDYQPRQAVDRSSEVPDRLPTLPVLRGLKVVISSQFLRTVIVLCAVGNFFFQTVSLSLVVLAEQRHMSSAGIGLLLATSGVGGIAGSVIAPAAGRRIQNEQNIIKLCAVAWTGLTLVVALSRQPVVGLIAWGALSVTGGFLNVVIFTYQARRVPGHLLGRVMGINRFVTSGAVPLGALSAGYIVAELRPEHAAWLAFGVIFSLTCGVLLRPRRLLPDRTVRLLRAWLAPDATPYSPQEIHATAPEPDSVYAQ